jgi:chemotaxis protein MotB
MSGARARKSAEAHEEGNSERWLLTYADMITLLLALFIVLFSFSSIDVKKFLELRLGLTAAFNPSAVALKGGSGLLDQTSLVNQPGSSTSRSASVVSESGSGAPASAEGTKIGGPNSQTIMNEIQAALIRAGVVKDAQVTQDYRGVVVQILADKVFFATDSADLGAAGRQVVDIVAQIVRPDPNPLIVEGFTDNVPVTGGPFTSNWELSAVRAANVVERLNEVDGIEESRLSSQGYGDTEPVASNDTPLGRSENRRIDVVVVSDPTSGS